VNPLPTAVFLDRDGTIIEDAHYLADPDKVKLLPGAAEAIARINALLIPVILITNQSGIGRGLITVDQHERVSRRFDELLAERGARIDAAYHCPHAPAEGCECRKPGTLLFHRAADENEGVDLAKALYIGDRMRDIEPGIHFGGSAVLIPSPDTPPDEVLEAESRARVATSLSAALDWYLCSN